VQSGLLCRRHLNLNDPNPLIFYKESKQMLYFTLKEGEYVISFQFPLDGGSWLQKLKGCEEHFFANGNTLVIRYVQSVLRGLQ
jgi:hypothetical protein